MGFNVNIGFTIDAIAFLVDYSFFLSEEWNCDLNIGALGPGEKTYVALEIGFNPLNYIYWSFWPII